MKGRQARAEQQNAELEPCVLLLGQGKGGLRAIVRSHRRRGAGRRASGRGPTGGAGGSGGESLAAWPWLRLRSALALLEAPGRTNANERCGLNCGLRDDRGAPSLGLQTWLRFLRVCTLGEREVFSTLSPQCRALGPSDLLLPNAEPSLI